MDVKQRFLRYVAVDTGSCEASESCPSTEKQWTLLRMLVDEMKAMGIADARVDEHGYAYGSIPATIDGAPAIGLIAHVDTVEGVPTGPVHARAIRYEGGDIVLTDALGGVMRDAAFESLRAHKGMELIVTDGTTLLGADDKAGIAEIMTACERLLAEPTRPHGKVCIAFTPDEEIGRGADLFDVPGFGADFAYTVDGGGLGEIEYENFNAASARVEVKGFNIHPGSAKNKMKNAARMAMRFASMLPDSETPEHTEGYEGFYHLVSIAGEEERAEIRYIIRDHDAERFEARKRRMQAICDYLNGECGAGSFTLTLRDSYRNMKEALADHMDVVERAEAAHRLEGVEPRCVPIRGGTDGARLSFMGLPCPNLSTGGHNGHGVMEYACVPEMEKMTNVLVRLITGAE